LCDFTALQTESSYVKLSNSWTFSDFRGQIPNFRNGSKLNNGWWRVFRGPSRIKSISRNLWTISKKFRQIPSKLENRIENHADYLKIVIWYGNVHKLRNALGGGGSAIRYEPFKTLGICFLLRRGVLKVEKFTLAKALLNWLESLSAAIPAIR
jgi:hypothetical protein